MPKSEAAKPDTAASKVAAPELPAATGSEVRRKAWAAEPRPARPMTWNASPPTVIRNLDALFAADRVKREAPTSRPPARAAVSGPAPIDPARFARMLLEKVEADFTPATARGPRPSAAPQEPVPAATESATPAAYVPAAYAPATHAPVAVAPVASPPPAPRLPAVVTFVPSPSAYVHYQETQELALPPDDEDVMGLVPWYRRLWSKLFG